jgi:alkylation response protein AidB-like acyl-CoA dehydrogenase
MVLTNRLQPVAERILCTLSQTLDALSPDRLASIPLPPVRQGYNKALLSRDEQVEVCAARWLAGGQSRLHGHGGSAALYQVVSGAVEEERYVPDGDGFRYESEVIPAGGCSYLPPGSFHRVRALGEAVTVHTYSPPPAEATAAVPPDTLRQLQRARRLAGNGRCTSPRHGTAPRARPAGGHAPAAGRRPDLLLEVRRRLDAWAEREAQSNRDGGVRVPAATVEDLRTSGILGAPMPAVLGGWDTSLRQAVTAVREVARRAPSTALALAMPLGNAATTRIPVLAVARGKRGALVEGQCWIAEQVHRGRILAVANTEPGVSDLAETKTTAAKGPDGQYRLTGRKAFATFGPDADYFLCAARRADGPGGREVVDGFFVAREAPGLTLDDKWDPAGMRPTASVGLSLQDAPAAALLGYPGCLEGVNARHWSTVLFAAVFLGVGEGALAEAVRQTPADAVWARATLAECALALDAAAGFIETVARDDGWPLPADTHARAGRAKTFAAKVAVETAVQAAVISGGRSYRADHPVFRLLCDSLAGPLVRPPLPRAMDGIIAQLFPGK